VNRKRTVVGVLVISILLATMTLSGTGLAASKIIMKVAHADATDVYTSRKHGQLVTFANLVNSQSGGRLEVQVFGAGAVGGEREYVEAVQAGRFHIWAIKNVDEGLEILTGVRAGVKGKDGKFPQDTLHYLADEQLNEWGRRSRRTGERIRKSGEK